MSVAPELRERFERDGHVVLPDVLPADRTAEIREAVAAAVPRSEARGMPVRIEALDPGGRNVRLYDLLEQVPAARELALHPLVLAWVEALLAGDALLSNFTGNNALPGSRSMNPHCDQSTVMPEPWPEMFAINAIWCLDDVDEENGATRYLPGSHRFSRFDDVPADPREGMRAFEARSGSVIVMHGRLWHTSGANRSRDRERWLLFAFYARSFLRPQASWHTVLSPETRRALSPELRAWLGLDSGNMGYGSYLAAPGGHRGPAVRRPSAD